MAYSYDLDLFGDLHKDARGCRPCTGFYEELQSSTPDELQALWDGLLGELQEARGRQAQAEAEALAMLHQRIEALQRQLGISPATALRWLAEANETEDDWHGLDWAFGVAFGTCEALAKTAA